MGPVGNIPRENAVKFDQVGNIYVEISYSLKLKEGATRTSFSGLQRFRRLTRLHLNINNEYYFAWVVHPSIGK